MKSQRSEPVQEVEEPKKKKVPVPEAEEEIEEEEEEEDEEEEDEEDENGEVEEEAPKKPKQKINPEELQKQRAEEVQLLQNAGIFRVELLYQLTQINQNLAVLNALIDKAIGDK